MRVLLVHDYCSLDGGAEVGTLTLKRGLMERGIDARVFTAQTGPNEIADHLCFGTKGRWRPLTQTANPSAWLALKAVLRDWKPDVVHVRMFLTQLSPLILPLLEGTPSLYHAVWYRAICPVGTKVLPDGTACRQQAGTVCLREGCLPAWDWAALMVQMRIFRKWRGSFRTVIANSHAVREKLEEAGIGPVEVIWNGVPCCDEPPGLGEEPVAVFAGRLVKEKGTEILLRALAQVPEGSLLIAGDGVERQALEKLTAELGLKDRVRFAGQLRPAEMRRQFEGAWVQVVPSLWAEPFGFVAPEAMMSARAVVASKAGGLAEVVADGSTGILVEPGNVNSLAEALRLTLGNRELCERMGRAGRERAMRHFSESRWVEEIVKVYERLIRQSQESLR